MRQRGLALLRQAAAGLARTSSSGVGPGGQQRLGRLAAAAQPPSSDSNGSGNGAGSAAGFSSRTPPQQQQQAAQQGSSTRRDALVDAAAPESWEPRQRQALRDSVQAKMAALWAHLGGRHVGLWGLRNQADQLAALGISAEELQKKVLSQYGTSDEAFDHLAGLVAAKQAAVMEGGAEHWAHLQEQRRLGGGSGAAQAPPPAQGPAATAAAQQGAGYQPSWRQQQRQEQQQQQPAWQQQAGELSEGEGGLEATPASSSQLDGGGRPGSGYVPPSQRPGGLAGLRQQQGAAEGAPPPMRASIRDLLNQRRIRLPAYSPGTYNHVACPECEGGEKNEKSLSVTIEEASDRAVWNCFRAKCGWTGSVSTQGGGASKAYRAYTNADGFAVTSMRKRREEAPQRPTPKFDAELSPEALEFFAARGISAATLARNRVAQERVADGSTALAFPYFRDGSLVNIKYRSLHEKKFWQVKNAEKVLFGLDDIAACTDIVIVEGELDKLALEEAGMTNVVSVPDGAPARVREGEVPPADQDTKFSYLWNCRAWLDQATRVVIATDNDAPGDALAEELARRLGRERCWRVRWPLNQDDHSYAAEAAGVEVPLPTQAAEAELANGAAAGNGGGEPADMAASLDGDGQPQQEGGAGGGGGGGGEAMALRVQAAWYRKDANEVLVRDGAPMLRAFVEAAEPFPIRGLMRFHEWYDDIVQYFRGELKDGQGRSTGWPALDQLYKVVPGELTIVTGVPNSGKSEWIDALLANLAEQHDWCFALCSMEKKATDHARQLVEKYVGKPFFDLPYARGVRRMSERELDEGLDWIDDRFHLVRYEDDALPAVDWVLDVARAAVYRYGIRGLVIDPYNELDHQRPASMNETEYVSQMLTKVKRFAQTTGVHVWFVAHPRQLREWKGQAPNLYDISGSAHFINKADNGIVVHRDRDPDAPDQHKVQILVRKVRNKAAGTIGDCVLEYERVNGRYVDPDCPYPPSPRTAQRVDFAALSRQQAAEAAAAEAAEAAQAAAATPPPVRAVAAASAPAPASAPGPAGLGAAGRMVPAAAGAQLHTQAAPARQAPQPPAPQRQQPQQQQQPQQLSYEQLQQRDQQRSQRLQEQAQRQQQVQAAAEEQMRAAEWSLPVVDPPRRPPPPPPLPTSREGLQRVDPPPPRRPPPPLNNDPVTDEQETQAWLDGGTSP